MQLSEFPTLLDDFPAYAELAGYLKETGVVQVEGLPAGAKSLVQARHYLDTGVRQAVVTYNLEQAIRMGEDISRYGIPAEQIIVLPSSLQTRFFEEGAPDLGQLGSRVAALQRIAQGDFAVVLGPIASFLQRTVRPERLADLSLTLMVGQSTDIPALEVKLTAFGYERVEAVEQPGQWTRRGGILDVFPGDSAKPYRIDFFGDEIESLRPFDVETQRSIDKSEALTLSSLRELVYTDEELAQALVRLRTELPVRMKELREVNEEGKGLEHADRLEERIAGDIAQLESRGTFDNLEYYIPYLEPGSITALDYLPSDTLIILDEPNQSSARWEQMTEEMSEIAATRSARGEWLSAETAHGVPIEVLTQTVERKEAHSLVFSLLGRSLEGLHFTHKVVVHASGMEVFAGRLHAFFEALQGWLDSRFRVILVTEQPEKLREMLAAHKIPASPLDRLHAGGESGVYVLEDLLPGGYKLPESALMVATDTDIFGHRAHQKAPKRVFNEGLKITSYLELREGDYVVHIHHGIGIYSGITRLKGPDGAERDYLLLEYAGGDKVYVPTDQVDRVQKYIGSQDSSPAVTRLNSGDWNRATRKAKKQVAEMAAELIKLYAARKAAGGHAMPPDTPWQSEMEDAFPYEETPDQMAAINDVKRDLEKEEPMDRLICGDVGFGKTEVAIRAAFKVASFGSQVAVLCPTTILAQQHWNTFRERLAPYPVTIEMLSRFVSKSEADRVVRGLAEGTVDIVVGTHKLLGKDIRYRNLGLLVVDEEQRFGVTHKERIKALKKSVDVLTLTATPIPRTLHMSLSGIRDMSLINDPPEGRLPIKTYVKEHDDELIREVLLREIDRGGQIYYLHNRIESISHIAEHLRRLVSQAKVEIAHGQMHEDDLEDAMLRFAAKEFNILVCTTIVESGLDIPNVNTIIVDNADKLGLSQLYQLRGRVGRSRKQGYAYLLYRKDKVLSEVAEKRLAALREFTDLGSGYKVALRDLEIRGAGNLLGAEQSGTVATVGFDLYTQLLSQAINELKGEDVEETNDLPNVALPIDANISARYIPSEAERILIYKKLAVVRKMEDVARIQEELEDRYGDPPKPVWNLLAMLRLRLRCQDIGLSSVVAEKRRVAIRFHGRHLVTDVIRRLARVHMQHQFLPDVVFVATSDTPAKMLTQVEEMVEILAKVMSGKPEDLDEVAPLPLVRPRTPIGYRR